MYMEKSPYIQGEISNIWVVYKEKSPIYGWYTRRNLRNPSTNREEILFVTRRYLRISQRNLRYTYRMDDQTQREYLRRNLCSSWVWVENSQIMKREILLHSSCEHGN